MRAPLRLVATLALAFTIVGGGCDASGGGSGDGAPDLGGNLAGPADLAGVFVPVSPPPLPLIPNHGGPLIAAPRIVTITWQGDPIAADLEAFDDWEVTSQFWKDLMGEWGVGPGTHAGSYRAPSPAPVMLDEAAVKSVISDAVAQAMVPSPAPDIVYTVYPPAGTTVVESGGFLGCTDFQAFHSLVDFGATRSFFAITPRCAMTSGFSDVDYVTWGMSHEVMEAASDPDFQHPAWRIDRQTLATPELGENADLCTGHPTKIEGHEVTRNYSNVAAMAGARPCVPAPDGPMFGAFADPGEVSVTPGGSASVTVRLYSTAEMPPFDLTVRSRSSLLVAAIDRKSGQNGDTATLTVSAAASWVEQPGANLIDIYSIISGITGITGYQTRRDLIVHAQ